MKRAQPSLLLLFACSLLAGCARNPNVEIVGSYFPGWMISMVFAVVLTYATRWLLVRQGLDSSVGHPALIYPCLVVLFTCLLWLCFFS